MKNRIWIIEGKEFFSSREAAEEFQVNAITIERRCKGFNSKGKYYPPLSGHSVIDINVPSSNSKAWKTWRQMRRRIERDSYKELGIKVCEEWSCMNTGFQSFSKWFDETYPNDPKLTLDRRDNEGDYSPDNCHWTTSEGQMRNTRSSKIWTINGIEYSSRSAAAEELGVSSSTIKVWCNGKAPDFLPKEGCSSRLKY